MVNLALRIIARLRPFDDPEDRVRVDYRGACPEARGYDYPRLIE